MKYLLFLALLAVNTILMFVTPLGNFFSTKSTEVWLATAKMTGSTLIRSNPLLIDYPFWLVVLLSSTYAIYWVFIKGRLEN